MLTETATRTRIEWVVRLDGVSRSARTDAGEMTLLAPTTAEQELCAALAIDHPASSPPVGGVVRRAATGGDRSLPARGSRVVRSRRADRSPGRDQRVAEQLLAARAAGSSVLVATHDEVVIDAADVLIRLR